MNDDMARQIAILECQDQIDSFIDYLQNLINDLDAGIFSEDQEPTFVEEYERASEILGELQTEYRRLTGDLPAKYTIAKWYPKTGERHHE